MRTMSILPKGFNLKAIVNGAVEYEWSGKAGTASLKWNDVINRGFVQISSVKIYMPEGLIAKHMCK